MPNIKGLPEIAAEKRDSRDINTRDANMRIK